MGTESGTSRRNGQAKPGEKRRPESVLARRAGLAFGALAIAWAALLTALPTPAPRSPEVMVIDNARYFDGERLRDPAAIVLEGGRVTAIGEPGSGPAGAGRIDAMGQTLLPGLIDAHVHSFGSARRDALDFGVTTVIDMFTAPAELEGARSERESFAAQERAALFSAGMLATVAGGHGTQYGIAMDTLEGPADAGPWVAARIAEGSDFIKLVYMPYARSTPSLDLATATALIEAAHAQGLLAVAHISTLAAAKELLDAGIDGFVHVFADALADEAFLAQAAEQDIFVVPTLAVIAMADGQSTGPSLIEDPHLGPRLGASATTNLRQVFGERSDGFSLETAMRNVALLNEAGIAILAGSDAPNPGTAHGATLHAELELLVQAGLSEKEALAAATSLPARRFSAEGRGRIEVGSRADLLLVNGDPLADISATRAIERVWRNGMAPRAGAAPGETTLDVAGLLDDFDERIAAPQGLVWAATSDRAMGGQSSASIERVARGDGGALAVSAQVQPGFAFPWAGAYLGVADENSVGNLGSARAIAFDVRGTTGPYRLMLFLRGSMGAPPSAGFTVTPEWRRVELPLNAMAGFDSRRFSGLAIVAPVSAGSWDFEIDNVTLVP